MRVTLFQDLPTEHWHSMERYSNELASALRQLGCDVQTYVAARPLLQLQGTVNVLANYAWRSLVYPRAARAHQGDVNHIVDHSYAHLINALDARRTVITCHDIAPLALDKGSGIGRRLWDQSFRAMLQATRIIADSEFTRDEILHYSNYPSDRIHVVSLAVSAAFFRPVAQEDLRGLRAQYHLPERRIILHVGTCEPRKNVEMILRALDSLRDLDAVLAQIGGRFTTSQIQLLDTLKLRESIVQIPQVAESELRAWYRTADVFVLPSSYEGFGLPVLEAMASGTPVVCAQASSLPNLVGDAALLTDPREPAKLAGAIRSVLTDSTHAADLRERGLTRAKLFTWERTARETLAVYQQMVQA